MRPIVVVLWAACVVGGVLQNAGCRCRCRRLEEEIEASNLATDSSVFVLFKNNERKYHLRESRYFVFIVRRPALVAAVILDKFWNDLAVAHQN